MTQFILFSGRIYPIHWGKCVQVDEFPPVWLNLPQT